MDSRGKTTAITNNFTCAKKPKNFKGEGSLRHCDLHCNFWEGGNYKVILADTI